MTQIISVITEDYALLASDRRLTIGEGPKRGQTVDNDTCKLVSLCNICGIGYSGLAYIENTPTHEWIANVLASENCHDPGHASRVLANKATLALPKSPWRHFFLLAGWATFEKLEGLRSHFCIISNALDESWQVLAQPRDKFDCRVGALHDGEKLRWYSIGEPLSNERARALDLHLRKAVSEQVGPRKMMRLLVNEIIYTSLEEKRKTVGSKVLGFYIPKRSVEFPVWEGMTTLLAKGPDDTTATFVYFDPTYSELQQYGPTFVCGEYAVTDVKTENDPRRNFQSSEVKLLSLPQRKT